MLTVTVDMHSQGLRFGLSTQGNYLMDLLLADPIPRQQLNASIFMALRPCLATLGPWSHGYGMRQDNFQVEIQVSVGEEGLQFVSVPQMSNLHHASSVTIQDLSEPEDISATVPVLNTVSEDLHDALADQEISVVPSVLLLEGTTCETDTASRATMQHSTTADLQPHTFLSDLPAPITGQSDTTLEHFSVTSPEDLPVPSLPETADADAAVTLAGPSDLHPGKSRKGKGQAPIDTASLRRSNRSNKYDGFRINLNNESCSNKSTMKPRVLPSVLPRATVVEDTEVNMQDAELPPPTSIPTLQNIGTHLCAIPAEELTEEILSKSDGGSASSST